MAEATDLNYLFVIWRKVAPATDLNPAGTFAPERTFPLPLPPTSISYAPAPPVTVRFTQGGASIQKGRLRRWTVRLQGEFGLRYRLGFDRAGVPIYQPGPELEREMFEFLQEYWGLTEKGIDARLSFHDFFHGRQLWVEHSDVSDGFDAQHRLDPYWTMGLIGYDRSGYPTEGLGAVLSILPRVREKLREVDKWLNLVTAGIEVAQLAVSSVNTIVGDTGELFDFLPRLISATSDLINEGTSLANYPAEFWRDQLEGIRGAMARIGDSIRQANMTADNLEALFAAKSQFRQLERSVGTAYMSTSSSLSVSAQTTDGAVFYQFTEGDSLQGIASKVLGDQAEWTTIASINGLVPPYVSEIGLPGTAYPGRLLILPFGAALPETIGDSVAESPDETALYGGDFALDDDGDLVAERGDYPADVQLVTGLPCLKQGLAKILFKTTQGESPIFPQLGIIAAVGDPDYANAGLVLTGLTDQVLQDDRIAAITDERASSDDGKILLDFRIVTRSGRRLPATTQVTT